jgi:3-mercaptopyruvate sulfurtransferase SseA
VALQLRRHGIRRVRPLLGGYYAWKELGYAIEEVLAQDDAGQELNAIASDGVA